MRNTRRSAGVLGIVALASIMIASCNNPTPTEPSVQAPALSVAENTCPTADQICNSIADEIQNLCPRTYPPRNWGEQNSCVKTLTARLLDSYKDCLTGNQLSEIRDCVYHELVLRNAGNYKTPDPYEF